MSEDADQPSQPGSGQTKARVLVDFSHASDHRAIHVDGVWGGVSPDGSIAATVFSEKPPVPQQITYEVGGGAPLREVTAERVETSSHILRELEATLHMSVKTARALSAWLTAKADECERLAANSTLILTKPAVRPPESEDV